MDTLELLVSLGNTADEVAASLTKLDMKGKVNNFHKCPIFNFLKANGKPVRLTGAWGISLVDEKIDPPKACSDFIRAFDARKYPNLIK
jgi:hypothetical protein